jgi:hypothetical protein
MSSTAALHLAAEIADAHASATLAAADHIAVSFSSGGLAFKAKGQADTLARVEARLNPHQQQITLAGANPRPWTVEVANSADLQSRLSRLRAGSRRFHWQPEDLGVFAAAAIWTYLTLPLLLDRAERVRRLRDAGRLRRLRIALPSAVAGHGRVQTLHVGRDSLIRRHDYTATAFGDWARAAQVIEGFENVDGVPIGTVRTVTPRIGRPLPAPTLVWIRIHSAQLVKPDRTVLSSNDTGTARGNGDDAL